MNTYTIMASNSQRSYHAYTVHADTPEAALEWAQREDDKLHAAGAAVGHILGSRAVERPHLWVKEAVNL